MLQGPNKVYKKIFFFHIQRRSALRTECYKLMFTNFTTLTCVSALSGKLRPVSRSSLSSSNATNHCILSGDLSFNDLIFSHIRYRSSYHVLSGLSSLDQEGPDSRYFISDERPEKCFREVASTREVYGKK